MALSRTEIQKKSNAKRGVCTKAYHMQQEAAAFIDRVAEQLAMPKGALIAEAVKAYAEARGIPTD